MNIAVTQRGVSLPERGECRDCLDRRLTLFLEACGLVCLPMPTLVSSPLEWLRSAGIGGMLISGGNDLEVLGEGDISPERDALERAILDIAEEHDFPVFGLCRGLQVMAHHHGARIVPVKDHAGRRHPLRGGRFQEDVVNSFHNYGCRPEGLPQRLRVLALSEDGVVEALGVSGLAQMAIMWHPEREEEFRPGDIALIKDFFNSGGKTPAS